jgi:hypothetical protein
MTTSLSKGARDSGRPGLFDIETASGRYVDLNDPQPETIALADIAYALAHTCRYSGHTSRFYSVAEHAVLVAERVIETGHPDLALAALHHDDAEAFFGDLTRPFKRLLRAYAGPVLTPLEDRLDRAIIRALTAGDTPHWTIHDYASAPVTQADLWAITIEARELLTSHGNGWRELPDLPPGKPRALGKPPDTARTEYLACHERLVAQAREATPNG